MKLVSVIVMSYRSADTIEETLDSIRDQTYKDIELIITDDCSTDDTVDVVRKWIESNQGILKDIKLVTAKKNTGLPGNINRALKQATGSYVKIIAADDLMTEDAIGEYVRFCEENHNKVPIAKVHLFGSDKVDVSSIERYCDKCYQFASATYKEQYRILLKQNVIVAPSASFYPMDIVRKLGGYDEGYRWFEDYPMNLKVMHTGIGFGLIDRELVLYRITDGSVTALRQKQLKKTEAKLFYRLRFGYMLRLGMIREALGQLRYWTRVLISR